MTQDEFKAELSDISESAKYAADPRVPVSRLATAILARIEATEAVAPAPLVSSEAVSTSTGA